MKKRMKKLLITSIIFLIVSILMIFLNNLSVDGLIINLSLLGVILLVVSLVGIVISFVK